MRDSICTNINEFEQSCTRPRVENSPVSLCQLHLLVAAQFGGDFEVPKVPRIRARSSRPLNDGGGRPLFRQFEPRVVYYIQKDNRVKIGTSTNLPNRLAVLSHDKLLVVEPGSLELERERHQQFDALALGGEWFRMGEPLVSHIQGLREEHGDPRALWNRIVQETTRRVSA